MPPFIPFEHLGGDGKLILFAHANAYPPLTYSRFFKAFEKRYRILAIYHRPLWPDSRPDEINSWEDIAADTLDFLRQRNAPPVIGIGHSLGAVSNMLAAAQDPARFRALVMIDPVFLAPALLNTLRLFPAAKKRLPIVRIARSRRHEWASREEAFAHFRQKTVFSGWSDQALEDYIRHGLKENGSGVTLAYPREWEARIYSLPPQVWKVVDRLEIPTLGIRGENSDALSVKAWQTWQKRQPAAQFIEMKGVGHLMPMERPAELAQHISRFIESLDE